MRLKRLELQGFKSFYDRTILTFDNSITGVVGPNGCGKSNIVDAILWVMGEQSPKHLRGESMTDIIFNGSENKAPTSMAEVSLVLDKQGVALSPQFSSFDKNEEISITRRIYRDGQGEFFINKVNCRLKDIHELFMDTGVGRRAYSIIEQGQIDRMINCKPDDRRTLFEEVAGITKYKAKKKEAEKKLENTRLNLVRVHDIIAELEKQIRSLKIQATRARKYREIKEELEKADLYLLGRNLYLHSRNLKQLLARKDILSAERSQLDADYSRADAELTELEIRRVDQEKHYEEWMLKERSLSVDVQKVESRLALLEEQKKHLSETLELNESEIAELRAKEEGLRAEAAALEDEIVKLNESGQVLERKLKEVEDEQRRATQRRSELLEDRNQFQLKKSQLSEEEFKLKSQIASSESKEQELKTKQEQLNQKLSGLILLLEEQKTKVEDAQTRIQLAERKTQEAESQAIAAKTECQTVSTQLTEAENDLFRARESFHTQKSRLDSLKELQENLEGYSPTAKELLQKLDSAGSKAAPLAEVVQPDKDLEEHLELLLGPDMNALVVADAQEAETLARHVGNSDLERVRIYALNDGVTLNPASEISSITEAVPLLSRLKIKPGYEAFATRFFENIYLTSTTEELLTLRKKCPGVTFLALDTQIESSGDGAFVSGALPSRTGVFTRRREIDELAALVLEAENGVRAATQKREDLFRDLESREKRHSELKDDLSRAHIESVEARKEKEKLQIEFSRTDRDLNTTQLESQSNIQAIENNRSAREATSDSLTTLLQTQVETNLSLEALENSLLVLENEFKSSMEAVGELRSERSRLTEKNHGLQIQKQGVSEDLLEAQDRLSSIEIQIERDRVALEKLGTEQIASQAELDSKKVQTAQAQVEIHDAKNNFQETCHSIVQFRETKEELHKRRDRVTSEYQETELKSVSEQSHLDQLQGIAEERYQKQVLPLDESNQIELEQLPLLANQLELEWVSLSDPDRKALLEDHVKTLREKVSRYGEVNLTAIQEFDEVQKRFDFLSEQRSDLEGSIKILEEAIVRIEESTKARFEETFNAVNLKFKEIFPILFNGGKAELSLTQTENVLEGGVDILAQPPGKRLQSISLLSGGEKALTAVSLVLSIFARKPSPFCLLDEVDAPLDDANVSRFNTVIRRMAEKTQFIVITHNKKTMEIAEALYGVTMERAGISKMTSVRMN